MVQRSNSGRSGLRCEALVLTQMITGASIDWSLDRRALRDMAARVLQ